jgi:hypothetical protein
VSTMRWSEALSTAHAEHLAQIRIPPDMLEATSVCECHIAWEQTR